MKTVCSKGRKTGGRLIHCLGSNKTRRYHGLLILMLFLSGVFLAPGSAGGREQESNKLVFTLPQLIEMALRESPELGEHRSEIAASRSNLDQACAAYYPQTEVTAIVGPVEDAKRPEVRNSRIHDPSPDSIGIFGRLDFTVMQPLYTFGKLDNRKEAAHQGLRVKELEIPRKKSQIILRVKQLYYALVLARQGIGVADESDEFLKDTRNRIERLLKAGSLNVTETDLYMVDAYSAASSTFRAEAENGQTVAQAMLMAMVNIPQEKKIELADKELPPLKQHLDDQGTLIKTAFAQRPELKQLDAALEAQKAQVYASQSDRYPTFFAAIEGSLAGAPEREKFNNPYINDEFNHVYAGIVAGLKWYFNFGILKAKVDAAQAEYTKLLYTKTHAERNIPIEVIKSLEDTQRWRQTAVAAETASRASRKWILTALTNFDMGIGTAKNIFDAIEKYGQNRGNYLEALYNYHLSLAKMEYAVGATAGESVGDIE